MGLSIYQAYHNKRVFITGHTGFKGGWLLAWLVNMGAIVKGFALPPESRHGVFSTLPHKFEVESVIADIRNRALLKNEVANFNPDYIFHLAAQPLVRFSYEHPAETFDINVTGTANLLEAAANLEGKCAIVVITTDKVYHNNEWYYPYREKDSLGGYDPYSASKACAELVVSSFRNSFFSPENYNSHHKSIATARAGNVIGGGDWSKNRIFPDIVQSLIDEVPINVRNPASVRPWQHVLEPLNGYLMLGANLYETGNEHEPSYNFGPEHNQQLKVKDIVELSIAKWGSGSWQNTQEVNAPHEAGLLGLDISLAKNKLNWYPLLSNEQAVEMTIRWYQHYHHTRTSIIEEQLALFENLINNKY